MLTENQVLQQGRYRIINRLGQNGIGEGYQAYDNVLETNVLLKEIQVSLNKVTTAAQMETLKLAFTDEAEFLQEIRHDALLHVRNYFSEIDRQYLVMELVDGNDLSELLEKKQSPFAVEQVTNWADQLLDALNYLHTRMPPVVHRDVKPQNIKLTSDGKIKLFAFGIARHSDAKLNATIRNQCFDAANLHYLPLEHIWEGLDTASRKVITNSYDEKSQKVLEKPADAQSDIYALGATLYHLLTNKLPVDALERTIEILEGNPDPLPTPHQLNADVPAEVSDVLMKALEIKRENRFSSAVIMRQVLRTAFAKIKERETAETKKQEETVAQQNRLAEEKRLEQERRQVEQEKLRIEAEQKRLAQQQQLVEQKRLEVEAEQKRQAELVQQQLREAEAQRLLAERRAAEAEKRLLEKEADVVLNFEDSDEDFLQIPEMESHAPDVVAYSAATQAADAGEEFGGLFASQQTENKSFKSMAMVAVVLLMLAGAGFGVWNFVLSKPAESTQTVSSGGTDKPVESAPANSSQTATVENIAATETPAATLPATQEVTETSTNSPALKNKPVVAPQPKNPNAPVPVKATPAPQKKAVTVDDLIGDN
ncbi:MAG: protein kinase [Pyrinomonadaceae bacterium]